MLNSQLAGLSCCVMALAIAGCGSPSTEAAVTNETATTNEATVVDPPPPPPPPPPSPPPPDTTQICADLRSERERGTREFAELAIDYPLTHIGIAGCTSSSASNADKRACMAAVVVTACLSMTTAECEDLTGRMNRNLRAHSRVADRMDGLGCAQ